MGNGSMRPHQGINLSDSDLSPEPPPCLEAPDCWAAGQDGSSDGDGGPLPLALSVPFTSGEFQTHAYHADGQRAQHHAPGRDEASATLQFECRWQQIAEALQESAMALVSAPDLETALGHVLKALYRVIPYESASVQRLEEEQLRVVAAHGFPPEQQVIGWVYPADTGNPSHEVLSQRRPLVLPDVLVRYPHFAEPSLCGIRAWMGVPLIFQGEVIGTMSLHRYQADPFSEDEAELAMAFASHAALVLATTRSREELAQARAHLMTFVHAAPGLVFTKDPHFRYLMVNQAFESLFGLAQQDVIGRTDWELLEPSQAAMFHQGDQLAAQSSGPIHLEVQVTGADGEEHILEVTKAPIRDADGRLIAISGFARDVTEERYIRARLFQSEKLSAVGQLVSSVAHELNNPLTVIMGYAQFLMERQDLSDSARADVLDIYQHAQRAARVVNNLLTFARNHPTERVPTYLNDVIERTLALRAYELRVSDIEVLTDMQRDLPQIVVDPHRLQQVILNLIINAEQALRECDKQDQPGRLIIRTRLVRALAHPDQGAEDGSLQMIRIEVEDNGPGIPQEILDRIFDPVFTTKPPGKGTGLGLSVCRNIVEEHGGRIWAENVRPHGARLIVELPMEQPEPAVEEPTQVALSDGPGRKSESPPPPSGSGRKVLVIDDEPSVARLLVSILEAEGHLVHAVQDGKDALQELQANRYDLVISDVKMPGMNGRRLYDYLQRHQPEMVNRLIFITGDTASTETWAFLEATGRPWVSKPFKVEAVRKALARCHTLQTA